MTFELHKGVNIDALRKMAPNSVDSVVTDPPYGLSREPDMAEVLRHWLAGDDYDHKASGFMGKSWDSFVPGPAVWREVLRVLKPGGYVFAFSGTRTYDMAVLAIRLAGFEIRDQFAWVYGSGMPKSLDIGKAIDRAAGAERMVTREGQTKAPEDAGKFDSAPSASRERRDEPATKDAAQWDGWGTAAKPAWEPIVLARKPFTGTVAANVLKHGTGGLNIDACRIPLGDETLREGAGTTWSTMHSHEGRSGDAERYARNFSGDRGHHGTRDAGETGATNIRVGGGTLEGGAPGRWPANLLHDGSDEVLAHFPSEAGAATPVRGIEPSAAGAGVVTGERARVPGAFHGDEGSAARFFYCAKASTAEREAGLEALQVGILARSCQAQSMGERGDVEGKLAGAFNVARARKNTHPTVKPVAVGRWLQRMITPPGGTTLDLFVGSGSFGASAILEGFNFIGIDIDDDGEGNPLGYLDIARARCVWAEGELVRERQRREQELREAVARAAQTGLFEEAA